MDISQHIHLLGDMLGGVISELESAEIFALEEKIRLAAKARRAGDKAAEGQLISLISSMTPREARAVASAFAIYFDLVNLAEENYRLSILRQQEDEESKGRKETIDEAIRTLRERGFSESQMASLVEELNIELVLTAHPTESRRRTVISKLQRLSGLLREYTLATGSKTQRERLKRSMVAEVSTLWLTDRNRLNKPAVTDEVRTGLYYIDSVFWSVIPWIYSDLDEALAKYYPGVTAHKTWLRLASWMGGDRDGNPFVTVEVTAETYRLHRGLAVENLRRHLKDLSRHLSISRRRLGIPQSLQAWIDSRQPLPEHVQYIADRYNAEPYRLILSLLAADLEAASSEDMKGKLLKGEHFTARVRYAEILEPIMEIYNNLPGIIANDELLSVFRELRVFGLHSARIDLRDDSSKYNRAVGEVMRALEICPNFEELPDHNRLALLTELLLKPVPDLAERPGVTATTADLWATFKLMGRVHNVYGPNLLGPVIISMTRSAADVLTVLLLARWSGVDFPVMITPLFESVADLQNSRRILTELFNNEVYKQHLEALKQHQMVMIGYSDSNKDGGYLMANWSLFQAQEQITDVAADFGVKLTIFHGRGGTVARGGGPANRAIQAQPVGSIHGRFRVTEQGEVIATRYSNPELAHRHLEQIVNAVLLASADSFESPEEQTRKRAIPAEWRAMMDKISNRALAQYRGLVYDTDGFNAFWQKVTPLDQITKLHLGSRPSARKVGTSVRSIRAIPWVFSWMQSRFNLPGWFGLGSGLAHADDLAMLQKMYQNWPFFSTLLNNAESSLLKADMEIAQVYTRLLAEDEAKETDGLFRLIRQEYDLTCQMVMQISGHTSLMQTEPVTQKAVKLRNPYIDPLSFMQVELLKRLRENGEEGEDTNLLREAVILTINGIAAGLKNTG